MIKAKFHICQSSGSIRRALLCKKLTTPHAGKSSTAAKLRGLGFYLWTILLAVPLFVTMLLMAPFVFLFDRFR
jgi:hypothetical protein